MDRIQSAFCEEMILLQVGDQCGEQRFSDQT